MSNCRLTAVAVCGVLLAACCQPLLAGDAAIGKQVENFSLRDFHGKPHSLADYADKKAVVIVLLGAECPMARLYAPRLVELAHEFGERGVAFLGVDANANDTPTKLTRFAQNYRRRLSLAQGRWQCPGRPTRRHAHSRGLRAR